MTFAEVASRYGYEVLGEHGDPSESYFEASVVRKQDLPITGSTPRIGMTRRVSTGNSANWIVSISVFDRAFGCHVFLHEDMRDPEEARFEALFKCLNDKKFYESELAEVRRSREVIVRCKKPELGDALEAMAFELEAVMDRYGVRPTEVIVVEPKR